jgi:hypothetical protein
VPNPGHSYTEIELPAGTWTGLDADKLDGMHAGQTGTNYIPYANASGRVGIGTNAPLERLHVVGGSASGGIQIEGSVADCQHLIGKDGLQIDNDGSFSRFFSNNGFKFYTSDCTVETGALTITGQGMVGVGTSNPSARLQVTEGDAYIESQGNGVILKATDGSKCYRLTVNNAGTLSTALVSCP